MSLRVVSLASLFSSQHCWMSLAMLLKTWGRREGGGWKERGREGGREGGEREKEREKEREREREM